MSNSRASAYNEKSSASQTVTEEDNKPNRHPTLRLKARVDSLVRQQNDASFLEKCRQLYLDLLQKAGRDIENKNLDDKEKLKLTERNMRIIDKIFDELVRQLNEQRDSIKKTLANLPPDQQQQVIEYWKSAGKFLGELIEWLNEMFMKILEKIKLGYKLNDNKVQELFDEVYANFVSIFQSCPEFKDNGDHEDQHHNGYDRQNSKK